MSKLHVLLIALGALLIGASIYVFGINPSVSENGWVASCGEDAAQMDADYGTNLSAKCGDKRDNVRFAGAVLAALGIATVAGTVIVPRIKDRQT